MKNNNKAKQGQENSAQASEGSKQQNQVRKWLAMEGPGLPASIKKQGGEAGLPAGLVSLLQEAFEEAPGFSLESPPPTGLKLARVLWTECAFFKLKEKVGEEKAREVIKLVEGVFPAGKDCQNAQAFLDEVRHAFTEKACNFLRLECSAKGFLSAQGWDGPEDIALTSVQRKLVCNLAAVFGNLKKYYFWHAERKEWVSIKDWREENKDSGEGEDVPKVKGKVDLSGLKDLSF